MKTLPQIRILTDKEWEASNKELQTNNSTPESVEEFINRSAGELQDKGKLITQIQIPSPIILTPNGDLILAIIHYNF